VAIIPKAQRRVREGVLPSARLTPGATAAAFGATDAQATAGLLQLVGTAINSTNLLTDKSIVRDRLNDNRSEIRQYMGEIATRKGEDAINSYSEVEAKLNDVRRQTLDGFSNQRQKDFYSSSYDPLMSSNLQNAIGFQTKARLEYERDTLLAANQNDVEDAVTNRLDKQAITDSKLRIEDRTKFLNRGLGKEIIGRKVDEAVNNMHVSVLGALTQDSPEAAQGYLEQNWEEFNPIMRENLKVQLQQKADAAWINSNAQRITKSGGDLAGQLKEVDKITAGATGTDVNRANNLRKVVKDRFSEFEAIRELNSKETLDTEADKIYKDPFAYTLDFAEFNAREQDYLYNLQKRVKNDKLAERGVGATTKSDPDTYMDLMSMPLEELRQEDLTKYVKALSSGDFKEVFKRQEGGDKTTNQMSALKTAISGMKDFRIIRKRGKRNEDASIRTSQLTAEYKKRLALIPPQEQTDAKLNDIIYNDLLAPVTTAPLSIKTTYRFQVPYLEGRKQARAIKDITPTNLRNNQNVEYDQDRNIFYLYGDGIRKVYDIEGTLLKKQRLVQ